MLVRFFGGWVWSEGKKKCKGERERREILTHTRSETRKSTRPFQHKIKMNDDRLAEAEEAEGKSLRTVDGVGQNGGRRCKVGQRVDCVRPSREPTSLI